MNAWNPVQTGRLPRRYKTASADFKAPVPDSLYKEGEGYKTNPEWEAAEYEEAFFDKDLKQLPPMSVYEAFRELNRQR